MRMVRAFAGILLLLVGVPLLFAGGGLWLLMQERDHSGAYRAPVGELTTRGHAVVVSDVDTLLRRDAPFARSGQTTLRLTAYTDRSPAFLGLGPAAEVARYLDDVPHLQVNQVRLARGPLPVVAEPVNGQAVPASPREQSFWVASSGIADGTLEWSPAHLRGEQLALVVMDPHAGAPLAVDLTAYLLPGWLPSTTWGLLVLGTVTVLVAVVVLAWPSPAREVVYVVPATEFASMTAQFGAPVGASPLAADPPATALTKPRPHQEPRRPTATLAEPADDRRTRPPTVWPPPRMRQMTAIPVSAPPRIG